MDGLLVEVDVVPAQGAQLAGAQAEGDGHNEQRGEPAVIGGGLVQAEASAAGPAGSGGQVVADVGHGGAVAGLVAAGQLPGSAGGVGRGLAVLADGDHGDVSSRLAGGSLEHLGGLLLGHDAGGPAGLALGQVGQLGHVPADEVVLLRAADGPGERALDHHYGALAEHLAQVAEEPLGFLGREGLELGLPDPRIDPFLCLAAVAGDGVGVQGQRVEPVADTLLSGVGLGSADTGLDLVV